jgi:hypothetical protein
MVYQEEGQLSEKRVAQVNVTKTGGNKESGTGHKC